ncbi:helix-turn-helix domain-containing protein [Salmonella enterica]|nr:helix-turn-helix domain-containing protein [Salmonella enterica]EDO1533284.1 helix-turn-helix domain-containing protein [Salmonella enterica subsp. enterica serovar Sandiego]EBI4448677.1 transcriptional regulator [Salmonella enterica]EBI8726579.1 helix-turn-helix domain-containing protein [Salmonella enterica]ECE2685121.1 helix-turn-helix domain-containing protein [Salmonella enterica]
MNISERLKRVLEAQNLTITDAAIKCGIPYRSLQNYLRGEREPKAEALVVIGTQLGISLDWLLTGRGVMHTSPNLPDNIESPLGEITLREQKWLELFRGLSPDVQKNILQHAEKEQRLYELEQKVQELEELKASIERLKNTG